MTDSITGSKKTSEIQFLGLGKLGLVLSVISVILIIGVAYFTPEIEKFLGAQLLVEGNTYANIAIRLYAGFLVSSVMTLTAQFIIWLLEKGGILGNIDGPALSEEIKTVRNFSVYALLILAAFLFLVAGKTIVRV